VLHFSGLRPLVTSKMKTQRFGSYICSHIWTWVALAWIVSNHIFFFFFFFSLFFFLLLLRRIRPQWPVTVSPSSCSQNWISLLKALILNHLKTLWVMEHFLKRISNINLMTLAKLHRFGICCLDLRTSMHDEVGSVLKEVVATCFVYFSSILLKELSKITK
jgi:hypothetical protein